MWGGYGKGKRRKGKCERQGINREEKEQVNFKRVTWLQKGRKGGLKSTYS
jgi:agmatine/peptidylarginine deiminase